MVPLFALALAPTMSGMHPSLAGNPASQAVALAEASPRWQQVHALFGLAALLGLGSVLVLRRLASGGEPSLLVDVAAVLGVGAAAVLVGVAAFEVTIVPQIARACVQQAASCLSEANGAFLDRLGYLTWNKVPPLGPAGRTLEVSLIALALIGWVRGGLQRWEAFLLIVGAAALLFVAPSLQGTSGLPAAALLLAGGIALGSRLVRGK
jgi:hypothetical protein